jgi:hypothetical protein
MRPCRGQITVPVRWVTYLVQGFFLSDLLYWFSHSYITLIFHSIKFSVLEFGVSVKTHLGRESKLYRIQNSYVSEVHSQQHACVVSAVSVGGNSKHVTRADDRRDVKRRQTDKVANTASMTPLSERLEVSECSKQVDIEEHQNKENENPAAHVKGDVNCDCSVIPLRNEERNSVDLGSRTEVPDRAYSTVLKDTVNSCRGTNFSQQMRIRMGTKAFSNVYKEDSSPCRKPYAAAPVTMSDTSKWSALQDAYVLSKYNFVFTVMTSVWQLLRHCCFVGPAWSYINMLFQS